MPNKKTVGFTQTTNKKKGKPSDAAVYSHKFHNLIPGDVAVNMEKALVELGLEFEEISTIQLTMSGNEEEIPFIRYQAEGGIEVPVGTWRVSGLGDLRVLTNGSGNAMHAVCTLENKSTKPLWHKVVAKTEELARSNSVFRGKALQVFEPQDILVPRSLNLSKDIRVIFNPEIEQDLNTCVIWPLVNRDKAKAAGIRVRRGALLDGFYGCGKSLFLYNAAKAASKAGWTVINLAPGMMGVASMLAPLVTPALLIVEDADAGTHGDRDALTPILNSLSSIGTKCDDDFVLLVSTNFLERIEPAILRPERIDAVIRVPLPNRETIKKLIRSFASGKVHPDATLDLAADVLDGCTPAIISEVIQRCLINIEMNGLPYVTEEIIADYTKQMAFQKSMAVPQLRTATPGDILAKTLHQVTEGSF